MDHPQHNKATCYLKDFYLPSHWMHFFWGNSQYSHRAFSIVWALEQLSKKEYNFSFSNLSSIKGGIKHSNILFNFHEKPLEEVIANVLKIGIKAKRLTKKMPDPVLSAFWLVFLVQTWSHNCSQKKISDYLNCAPTHKNVNEVSTNNWIIWEMVSETLRTMHSMWITHVQLKIRQEFP